jgi:hypothetical protein
LVFLEVSIYRVVAERGITFDIYVKIIPRRNYIYFVVRCDAHQAGPPHDSRVAYTFFPLIWRTELPFVITRMRRSIAHTLEHTRCFEQAANIQHLQWVRFVRGALQAWTAASSPKLVLYGHEFGRSFRIPGARDIQAVR